MKSELKVLVFGGSGFIGSHVVAELLKRGYRVGVFDRVAPLQKENCEIFIGDILDQKKVAEAVKGYQVIYNFAGWADLTSSSDEPLEVIKQNILGNSIILDEARKNKVGRYIYASSVYVFSKAGSFYRTSKQACELIIEEYQKQFGLDFTILRFGSLYGPGAKKGNAIHDIVTSAIEKKKIDYWGTGDELRQYIHVSDAARGSVDILSDEYKNEHVILSGEEDIRLKDLLEMINEIFSHSLEINYTPSPRSETHYKITPYSFNPRLGKKLTFKSYTDIGQGLLQCIQKIYEEVHYDKLDALGQFNAELKGK